MPGFRYIDKLLEIAYRTPEEFVCHHQYLFVIIFMHCKNATGTAFEQIYF